MTNTQFLPQLELKLWLKIFDDGIYDIFLGWILLWMGIVFATSDFGIPSIPMIIINVSGIALSVLAMRFAKKRITFPRMGHVRFSKRRMSKVAVSSAVGILLAGGAFTLSLQSWIGGESLLAEIKSPMSHAMMLALFLFFLFTVHAFLLDFDRLIFIGLMFAAPFPISAALRYYAHIDIGIFTQIIPAIIVIAVGVRLLMKFIRNHPIQNDLIESSDT